MTSSKYIQLTNSILLEYIYNTNTDSGYDDKYSKNLTGMGAYMLYDNYTENSVFYTNESQWDNRWNDNDDLVVPVNTNTTTFVNVNSTTDRLSKYYNVDVYNFENTNILNKISAEYKENTPFDKIRLHFAQGFDFTEFDGYVLQVGVSTKEPKVTKNGGNKQIILCSQFVNKKDDFGLNPNPFLIGEKMYATYYDIYIPCIDSLVKQPCTKDEDVSDENETLSYTLTNGYGFENSPNISINLFGAYKCDNIRPTGSNDKYLYSYVHGIQGTKISYNDLYADIVPSIVEVDDYFKLEGSLQNSEMSFSDYINSMPGTYILMHDIVVQECIEDSNSVSGVSWIMTTHNIITQTGDFEEPVYFRPVLKYTNSINCTIDYSLRIYCETTNVQIIKRATFEDFNHKKYGKRMVKIDLGVSPQQVNVYNKIDPSDVPNITFTDSNYGEQLKQQNSIIATKYVTAFRDRINIKASISTVKIQNITQQPQQNS